jgi:hypothetical protein
VTNRHHDAATIDEAVRRIGRAMESAVVRRATAGF